MSHVQTTHLAHYIATYIQEELSRGLSPDDISMTLIKNALDAFEGGAADTQAEVK